MALPNKTYTEVVTETLKFYAAKERVAMIQSMVQANPKLMDLFGTGLKDDLSMLSDAEIRRISDRLYADERKRRDEGVEAKPKDMTFDWRSVTSAVDYTSSQRDDAVTARISGSYRVLPRDVFVIDGNTVLRKDIVTDLEVVNGDYVPDGYVRSAEMQLWYKPPDRAKPVAQPEPESLWPPKRELDL